MDKIKELLEKIVRNYSTGRDDEFGGHFVCFHGLSEQDVKEIIAFRKTINR